MVYHLDRNGDRDAMVDPYTGMAYVLEAKTDAKGNHVADRVLVWPVNLAEDEYGNVISRDKITTSRIATVGENQDGYNEDQMLEVTNHSGHAIPDSEKPSYTHTESGSIHRHLEIRKRGRKSPRDHAEYKPAGPEPEW